MKNDPAIEQILDAINTARGSREPLALVGGGTKAFYGREIKARPLTLAGCTGIVDYQPTELVVTVKSGTRIVDLNATLAEQGQHLAFEPPCFGTAATVGGMVAAGLAGPARPYTGALRDYVLGVTMINGKAEILRFGGQVMKNVAGFDLARLMSGALGTLGVLLEVSLKVMPTPALTVTLRTELPLLDALALCQRLGDTPLPLTGAAFDGQYLYLRLAGSDAAVADAVTRIPADRDSSGASFWQALREHTLPFFDNEIPLWRLSVPPITPPLELAGDWLIDWGGAQRWLKTSQDAKEIRACAAQVGGHASLFRFGDRRGEIFHPLSAVAEDYHVRIKQAFDPDRILNPGRIYREP